MSVLLDTHALVWLLEGNERLGSTSRDLINVAASSSVLFVSAITPWEIAMLVSKNRLTLAQDVGEWLHDALSLPGIRLEPLSVEVSVGSTRLPGEFHADPADRIIVATARHLGAVLITEDKLILGYAAQGLVKAHRASA